MQVEVEHVLEPRSTDSRGRVRLGTEYANMKVRVAVVEQIGESQQQDYPQPTACAECGRSVQQFALVDGSALCLECAGLAEAASE